MSAARSGIAPVSRSEPETPPEVRGGLSVVALVAAALLIAGTLVTFWPVRDHAFLNWDDGDVMTAPSQQPDERSLVAWAFTTTHMQHVQPLAWLALDAIAGRPPSARRVHTAAVVVHAANVALLFLLVATLLPRDDEDDTTRWLVAAAATAAFALHPMRVEPVAWASALPYLLSYLPLLGAMLAFVSWLRRDDGWRLALAVALFAVSQATRVTAALLPLALPAIGAVTPGARPRSPRALVVAALLFAAVAVPLALLEAGARQVESLADIGFEPRLAAALTAPARYAWRTVAPLGLTPLDVWPRVPSADWGVVVVLLMATGVVGALSWTLSNRATLAVWGVYLLLLAPVSGLLPSGLQVTADRYTYGPAMALAGGLAGLLALLPGGVRRVGFLALGAGAVVLAQSAHVQADYWRDSVTLWSRALALDGGNDVALFNLALAEADAGRRDPAIEHLQQLLTLVPDHGPGRARLAALVADRETAAGDAAADAGQLQTAIAAFTRALGADPGRGTARLHRGMARAQLGQLGPAAEDLAASLGPTLPDSPVVSALAMAWAATGRGADAVALLQRARRERPDDAAIAGNLAQLLLTAEPPSLRDADAALAIAAPLNDRTGGRDPRMLALLADALAATGRIGDARDALGVAIGLAADAGDRALAASLSERRTALGR